MGSAAAMGAAQSVFGAPGDTVRVGCIGMGGRGNDHLKTFLNHGETQVLAVCDPFQSKRDAAKTAVEKRYADLAGSGGYKACQAYSDFRELLARTDIDAVHVATPDHWHAVIVTAACRAGKDVYCQKPESLTIHEGRAMVDTARRFNRVVSGGSQRVMGDYMNTVRKCWSGEIGTPKEVFVNCGGPSQPCYLPGRAVK